MLTTKDIDEIESRLRDVFVTKDEFQKFRSDFFDKIDAFVKEVRDSHEERTIMAGQISELNDRVEKLETTQAN